MSRLFLLLYSVIGTSLAGAGIIAVLTAGLVSLQPILFAAAAGALVAIPVSWIVARNLDQRAG